MKKLTGTGLWLLMAAAVICFALPVTPAGAQGKSPTAIEGVKFDAFGSMRDSLKSFMGKDVHLHLRSGKTFQGYVKSVGDNFVHLEKLAGRDFYDVLVRIDDVSALETKFRDLK
jgi:hypothetical protein